MTQPAVIEEPKIITAEQLEAAIRKASDLDEEEFDSIRRTMAMPGGWRVGGSVPIQGLPPAAIDALFAGEGSDETSDDHMPGDVRVYARPLRFADENGDPAPFMRFVLNRAPNTPVRTDFMSMQTYVETVGAEYAALLLEEDSDDEPEHCSACKAALVDDAKFCHACATPARRCAASITPDGSLCGAVPEPHHRFCAACGTPLPPRG